jgi:hypothetical protein
MKRFNRWCSAVKHELLSGRNYDFSYVLGETLEVFEALWKLDFKEAKSELQQVWYGLQMQVHQITGIDFRLTWCADVVQSFYDRRIIWREIFAEFDTEFKNEYLVNGSNWQRPHKVVLALGLAGITVTEQWAKERVACLIVEKK